MDSILIQDFNYSLPDKNIAKYPLKERDESKLLVYKDGNITDTIFKNCIDFLPDDSFLVFNNTKVIKARLFFEKTTGAVIEIFCLEPVGIQEDYNSKLWKCFIGNNKKWKNGTLSTTFYYHDNLVTLTVERVQNEDETWIVEFSWSEPQLSIYDIFEILGKMPLPPYLHRDAEEQDEITYQTIYARHEGSVAAPTAGLHFTDKLLTELKAKHIETDFVTLHVGAGTFKPVTTEDTADHNMHIERIEVHWDLLQKLIQNQHKTIIPVGTTSMRTLESLYWIGVKNLLAGKDEFITEIAQWDAYQDIYQKPMFSVQEALQCIIGKMQERGLKILLGETQIMIRPGYEFHIAKGIFTNFHQPQSTLLLLISAFIGNVWKDIYQHALIHDYRFLSYGDACLFLR